MALVKMNKSFLLRILILVILITIPCLVNAEDQTTDGEHKEKYKSGKLKRT